MTRHFLRDDDLTPDEQSAVLDLAARLKADRTAARPLAGPRSVAIVFDKPTLRTQLSFSVGVAELGGHPMVVDGSLAQIGTRESIPDVTRVLTRQVAAIVWRTGAHARIEEMARHATVPVVNALTDDVHPCQGLADLLTLREHLGGTAGRTLTYLGDTANNMAHTYLLAGATAGMHVRLAGPVHLRPDPAILGRAQEIAATTGGSVSVLDDPRAAAEGADALVTDTWVSMGQEDQAAGRRGQESPLRAYALGPELVGLAAGHAVVLHCLPAYRGQEIAAEVIDGPRSVVWDEAENRLHAQKALLTFLLEGAQGDPR